MSRSLEGLKVAPGGRFVVPSSVGSKLQLNVENFSNLESSPSLLLHLCNLCSDLIFRQLACVCCELEQVWTAAPSGWQVPMSSPARNAGKEMVVQPSAGTLPYLLFWLHAETQGAFRMPYFIVTLYWSRRMRPAAATESLECISRA